MVYDIVFGLQEQDKVGVSFANPVWYIFALDFFFSKRISPLTSFKTNGGYKMLCSAQGGGGGGLGYPQVGILALRWCSRFLLLKFTVLSSKLKRLRTVTEHPSTRYFSVTPLPLPWPPYALLRLRTSVALVGRGALPFRWWRTCKPTAYRSIATGETSSKRCSPITCSRCL